MQVLISRVDSIQKIMKMHWIMRFALTISLFWIIQLVSSKQVLPTCPPPKCLAETENLYPPPKETALKWYTVNLDKAPEDRWTEIVTEYKQEIKDLVTKSLVVKDVIVALKQFDFTLFIERFPSPYREELKGIAAVTEIPVGDLVYYNLFYEVYTLCTAILAKDRNGNVYHARNMDFGLGLEWKAGTNEWIIPQLLRKLQIQANFTRNGKTLFQSVVFPGFVGIFSAMKKNKFTLTLNARNVKGGSQDGLIDWATGNSNRYLSTLLTRDAMEKCDNYYDAKKMLMIRNITAPVYYLLGGTKSTEGCMIIRGLTNQPGILELGQRPCTWYILQTNYDPWTKPPSVDDRRTPGTDCTEQMSQDRVGFPGLFKVLSSPPNFNLMTVFTHLMNVNTGMEAYSQQSKQPRCRKT